MGDIAHTLGLGGPPQQTAQPMPSISGDPLVAAVRGTSQPTPEVPSEQTGAPQTTPSLDIVGWKPHKRTFLGALADAVLSGVANKQVKPFADKIEKENMQEAMEGFTQDPENTIRRIAKINPTAALALQEKYVDNQRAARSQDRLDEALAQRNDDYMYNYVANGMGAATPENWSKFRNTMIQRAASRHVDVSSIIPEQYDPDSIEFMRYGSVKTKDQMNLEEKNRHNVTREGQMQQGIDEHARHDQVTEGTGAGRLTETMRHNRTTEGQAVTNETGRNNRSKNGAPTVIDTPNGPMVLGKSDPTKGKIGDQLWQKTGPGKWKRVK